MLNITSEAELSQQQAKRFATREDCQRTIYVCKHAEIQAAIVALQPQLAKVKKEKKHQAQRQQQQQHDAIVAEVAVAVGVQE